MKSAEPDEVFCSLFVLNIFALDVNVYVCFGAIFVFLHRHIHRLVHTRVLD